MLHATPAWREKWIKSRLGLDHYHPDVVLLEDAIWNFCVGFCQNPVRGKRLVIHGANGNGKTRSCRAVKRWIQDRAMELPLVETDEGCRVAECVMVNWPERVDLFKEGDWSINPLIEANLLILDDVGAEHDPSKSGLAKLYLILERREWRWTIITTNLMPQAWESKFERRVADRLFRNADHLDLSRLPSYSVSQT